MTVGCVHMGRGTNYAAGEVRVVSTYTTQGVGVGAAKQPSQILNNQCKPAAARHRTASVNRQVRRLCKRIRELPEASKRYHVQVKHTLL